MKPQTKIFILLNCIFFLCLTSLAENQFIIESRLFKGIKHERKAETEVVISSLSEPFFVPVRPSDIDREKRSISLIKRELRDLYQLSRVDHMVSAKMIWDGKKESLTKTILLEGSLLPIQFFPEIVSDQEVNLRVVVRQLTGKEIKLKTSGIEGRKANKAWVLSGAVEMTASETEVSELFDTEITIQFNQPVVLGFPVNGNSYFLEVVFNNMKNQENLKKSRENLLGYPEIVRTEMELMTPPNPVREVPPVYPEKCKEKKIEGSVILRVETDREGNVVGVKVLKGVHKELDRAAVEAVKLWKYEQVKKDGKPVPVVFTITVDFKLRDEGKKGNRILLEES